MSHRRRLAGLDLSPLTRAAFRGNPRDAVQRLLERVAKMMNCYGCVLWQATDDANPWATPPQGALFMLGTWFPENATFGIHNLKFDKSLAGECIKNRAPKIEPNIPTTDAEFKNHAFLKLHQLTQTLVAPLEYQEDGPGKIGAISLYRQTSQVPFDPEGIEQLKHVLSVLPTLVEASRKSARLELMERVSAAFQTPSRETLRQVKQPFQSALNKVASAITQTFHTSEAMILLRDSPSDAEQFRSWAANAPPFLKQKLGRKLHHPSVVEQSFTSLCLVARRSVRVLNLSDPARDVEWWNRHGFPLFRWSKVKEVERDARKVLGIKPRATLPPLSFLAVPILNGDELIGAFRCWVPRPGLAYFSKADERLLEAVASQVGHSWKAHQREIRVAEEAEAWQAAAQEFVARPDQACQKLGQDDNEGVAAIAALRLADNLFSDSVINDIRLIDEESQQLYAAYIPVRPKDSQLSTTQWKHCFDGRLSLTDTTGDPAVEAVAGRLAACRTLPKHGVDATGSNGSTIRQHRPRHTFASAA